MANQKAELHSIPLKTLDVCLNKYDHDIKPYEGFRKNNSPFYGNLLSPFYKKSYASIGEQSFVTKDGLMYFLDSGVLKLRSNDGSADTTLSNFSTDRFLTKESVLVSGNTTYPTILAFIKKPSDYAMLCVSSSNRPAIVASDGTIVKAFTGDVIRPDSKIYFAEYTDGAYCFASEDNLFVLDSSNTTHKYSINTLAPDFKNLNKTCSCTVLAYSGTNYFAVCIWNVPNANSMAVTSSYSLIVNTSTGATLPVTRYCLYRNGLENWPAGTHAKWGIFFNGKGDAIVTDPTGPNGLHTSSAVNFMGKVTAVKSISSDHCELSFVVDELSTIDVSYYPDPNYTINALDFICDQYAAMNVTGFYIPSNSWDGYKAYNGHPDYTIAEQEKSQKTITYTDKNGNSVTKDIQFISGESVATIPAQAAWTAWADTRITDGPHTYMVMYHDANEQLLHYQVPIDEFGRLNAGHCIRLTTGEGSIRILYNNHTISGISVSGDDLSIGTMLCILDDIDSSVPITTWTKNSETFVTFKDSEGWKKVKISSNAENAKLNVMNNRYIVINNARYYNCYDTEDCKWYHFGSDWNDRVFDSTPGPAVSLPSTTNFSDYKTNACWLYSFASGQPADSAVLGTPFKSSLRPSYSGYLSIATANFYRTAIFGYTIDNTDIDFYKGLYSAVANNPNYLESLDYYYDIRPGYGNSSLLNNVYQNQKLVGTNWSFSLTYIPTIFTKFLDGFINRGIFVDGNKSYLQELVNGTEPIFAIKFVSYFKGIQYAFIIQQQYFVVINGSIYRYEGETTAPTALLNIGDMQLVGYNPYMAIFWAPANRTFYRYTGDILLEPLVQADEISQVLSSTYNPSTLSIYATSGDYTLIFSQDFLVKLPKSGYKCFAVNNGCVLVNDTETLFLSYNKAENYEVEPIELETECYGLGNSVKSVNDCVYVRLFDEDMKEGIVKVSSETLNETVKVAEEKVFNITKDKWDKNSKTIFLRYQPKYQAATGFSVKIKSPFAIASLQISAQPETVQNSKYNI